MRNQFYRYYGKRILDVTLAFIALVLFAPVLLMIALLVRVKLGSPILFRQQRPGYNGKPFYIFKFRTMTDAYDSEGKLLSDAERLTAFGRSLRSTSLDELPELLNVLRGKMSLVGPRPLLIQYLEHYSTEQARRHEVKPGITGWAQINGRNTITWEERFKLDVWYVDNVSLWLDIKIMLLTVDRVIRRDNIQQEGHATMTEFSGNREL